MRLSTIGETADRDTLEVATVSHSRMSFSLGRFTLEVLAVT